MKDLAHCSQNDLIAIIEQQNARIAALESQIERLSQDSTPPSKPPKGGKESGKRKKKVAG